MHLGSYASAPAALEDAAALADAIHGNYEALFRRPFCVERGALEQRWILYTRGEQNPQKAFPPRIVYKAVCGSQTGGFAAGHHTERFGMDGELQSIYVVPEHQGQGLGTRLVMEIARWLHARGAAGICVNAKDESAGFYTKPGARRYRPGWLVWDDMPRRLGV